MAGSVCFPFAKHSFLQNLALTVVIAASVSSPAFGLEESTPKVVEESTAKLAEDAESKKADDAELLKTGVQVSVEAPDSLFSRLPLAEPEQPKQNKVVSVGKLAKGTATSLAAFMLDTRGFDWSKEGADLVLGQKQWNSESGKEFLARMKQDRKEANTIQNIMQLAASMDRDPEKTAKAREALVGIIGEEQTQKIYDEIAALPGAELPADREKLAWDINERKEKLTAILEKSAAQDKVLQGLGTKLSKYNHRSKAMQVFAKVAYTSLGIAAFSPTLVAPIAETALLTFMYASGGPEQDKLLRELYLSKMMQSRCDLTNEKAQMVVSSADLALLTNNKRLYAWSKELLSSMTDKQTSESLFAKSSADSSKKLAKEDAGASVQ